MNKTLMLGYTFNGLGGASVSYAISYQNQLLGFFAVMLLIFGTRIICDQQK